jgi:hypothetical protein
MVGSGHPEAALRLLPMGCWLATGGTATAPLGSGAAATEAGAGAAGAAGAGAARMASAGVAGGGCGRRE